MAPVFVDEATGRSSCPSRLADALLFGTHPTTTRSPIAAAVVRDHLTAPISRRVSSEISVRHTHPLRANPSSPHQPVFSCPRWRSLSPPSYPSNSFNPSDSPSLPRPDVTPLGRLLWQRELLLSLRPSRERLLFRPPRRLPLYPPPRPPRQSPSQITPPTQLTKSLPSQKITSASEVSRTSTGSFRRSLSKRRGNMTPRRRPTGGSPARREVRWSLLPPMGEGSTKSSLGRELRVCQS